MTTTTRKLLSDPADYAEALARCFGGDRAAADVAFCEACAAGQWPGVKLGSAWVEAVRDYLGARTYGAELTPAAARRQAMADQAKPGRRQMGS